MWLVAAPRLSRIALSPLNAPAFHDWSVTGPGVSSATWNALAESPPAPPPACRVSVPPHAATTAAAIAAAVWTRVDNVRGEPGRIILTLCAAIGCRNVDK